MSHHAKRSRLFQAIALVTFAASVSMAQADDGTHVGVALTAGLSGIGGDLGVNINDYLGVRASVSDFSFSRSGNYGTSVGWDAKLKLFQAGALLDVYPFAGVFHLTGGVVKDGNKFSLNGRPSSGTYTFNGVSYNATDIGNAAASVEWNKAVPYVGLGWGNLSGSKGFHFTTDLGALITGKPTATLTATCNNPSVCGTFQTDIAAEQTKLQNDVRNVTFWPVIRFAIGYAF